MENTNEKRIYGEWFPEKMAARLKRDKAQFAVKPCIIEYSRYRVRGYYHIDGYGRAWTYTLRRDGRVGQSWVNVPVSQIEDAPGETIQA